MSMKNQLKKSLPNLPLILRGGMEGINNLGPINLPRSLRHAFLVMTVQLKQNPASFLKAGEKT